jgi:dihydroflavonol-4-reductase
MASITDSPENGYVYTGSYFVFSFHFLEKDWNTKSSLTRNPYYYSKKVAEEAAWNFVEEKKPHFNLVVINVH